MSKHTYTANRISRKSIRSISTRPQEGQSLVEYSLLLGLIAVAVIAVISVLGVQLNNTFTSVTDSLGGTSVPYTPGATTQAAATTAPAGNNSGSGNSGSGGSGSGDSGSGGGGGFPTTAAVTTAAPTATPVPTTAAPTTTVAPTTAAPTTAAPTTAAPTATPKPTTAAPTATVAPTSTPVPTTAAPTATPKPTTTTPTATTAASGLYTVTYNKTNQWYAWDNGTPIATTYEVNVVITNKSSSTVNSWTISWKLENGESFYSYWNANCSISGSTITCTNPSGYNTVMSPNGTVSFYVQLNSVNMNITVPKTYTVNGTTVAA